MKAIKFDEKCKPYAENQEEYYTLHVLEIHDKEYGHIKISAWKPGFIEKIKILFGGLIYLAVVGGQPPVDISLDRFRFDPKES